MFMASAYPSSEISALAMMAIAFVMAGVLALWLGMVFIADRQSGKPDRKQSRGYTTTVAAPGKTTEDGRSEPESHGAAA